MDLRKKIIFYMKCFRVYLHYHINEHFPKIKKILPYRVDYIPALVIIGPTNKCNLKCFYCTNIKKKEYSTLSKTKLLSIVKECIELGVPYISFTGGEPLLHKDIEDIALFAQKNNMVVNLNTNGTLITEKRAKKISKSFDQIRISLDGIGATFDNICNVKGTFEKIVKNIGYLMAIKNKKARIGINCVISNKNIHQIDEFINFFNTKIDFISILPKFSFDQKIKEKMQKIPENVLLAHQKLMKEYKTGNSTIFLKESSLDYTRENCDAGKLYISVWCDGTVNACVFNSEDKKMDKLSVLGNINEENFIEIWKSRKLKNPASICNGCYATCTTEISRIFRMTPLQIIKNFHNLKKTFKI